MKKVSKTQNKRLPAIDDSFSLVLNTIVKTYLFNMEPTGERANEITQDEQCVNLSITDYDWWYEAITQDDIETVTDILSTHNNGSTYDRKLLLNGIFDFGSRCEQLVEDKLPWTQRAKRDKYDVRRPWCLAGVYQAHECLKLLVEHEVDLHQKDNEGNNIIHCLVVVSHLVPDQELHLVDTFKFLVSLLSVSEVKQMLYTENDLELRPLEYAAHLCVFDLLQAMLDTRGVYLAAVQNNGIFTTHWYDVTEYETVDQNISRLQKSPFNFLCMIDSYILPRESTQRLFSSNILETWLSSKMKIYTHFEMGLILCQMTVTIMFILLQIGSFWVLFSDDVDGMYIQRKNTSCNDSQEYVECSSILNTRFSRILNITLAAVLFVIGILSSLYISIFCIYLLYLSKHDFSWYFNLLTRKKNPAVHYTFHIFMFFISTVGMTILSGLVLAAYCNLGPFPATVVNVIHVMSSTSLMWCFIANLQNNASVGHYILIVQKMTMDLVIFVFVFLPLWIPFMAPFSYIINDYSSNTCQDGFQDPVQIAYTLLKALFNSVNFKEYVIDDQIGLIITHTLYIVTGCMLLIHLIIAMFSDSVAYISRYKHIYITLQNILAITRFDQNIFRQSLFANYISKQQERHYTISEKSIYLECTYAMKR